MKLTRSLVAAALLASVLPACAPLLIGTIAVGTAIVATDRRTTGAQVDDSAIQLRLGNELGTAFNNRKDVHISINSYERKVLLTGEVPTEDDKAKAGDIAARSTNVRMVVNELAVGPVSSMSDRTNDTTLGTKVRAQLVNTKEVPFNAVGIVTERGVIYLMGFVTQKEGEIAAYVASRVSGVKQVVKVFDYGTAEDVQKRRIGASQPAAPAAGAAPVTESVPNVTPGTAQ